MRPLRHSMFFSSYCELHIVDHNCTILGPKTLSHIHTHTHNHTHTYIYIYICIYVVYYNHSATILLHYSSTLFTFAVSAVSEVLAWRPAANGCSCAPLISQEI